MLTITNLHVSIEGKPVLNGITLHVPKGKIHAIMGPNGSGKSTLANVLAGREGYDVTQGEVLFDGRDLLKMSVDERAREGVFLAFQYPVEIPGVSSVNFLKHAVNAVHQHRHEKTLDAVDFLKLIKAKQAGLGIPESLLYRAVNQGFSGGEKKRFEILQMAMLEPRLAILDETDSGLDIDALKTVADGVNALRNAQRTMLVITHYQRLLEYIIPDKVHVLVGGSIVQSGGRELAKALEKTGYSGY